jgi:hypothetical protein
LAVRRKHQRFLVPVAAATVLVSLVSAPGRVDATVTPATVAAVATAPAPTSQAAATVSAGVGAISVIDLLGQLDRSLNQESYATNSYTPHPDRMLVAIAALGATDADLVGSGNGLTWTRQYHLVSVPTFRVAVFTAPTGGSPSAGAFRVTCTGDAASGAFIAVYETDADQTTPIAHEIDEIIDGVAGGGRTTYSLTLTQPTAADAGVITWMWTGKSPPDATPPTGFTRDTNLGHGTPTEGFTSAHHVSPGSVSSLTWSGVQMGGWDLFALELAPAVASNQAPATRRIGDR